MLLYNIQFSAITILALHYWFTAFGSLDDMAYLLLSIREISVRFVAQLTMGRSGYDVTGNYNGPHLSFLKPSSSSCPEQHQQRSLMGVDENCCASHEVDEEKTIEDEKPLVSANKMITPRSLHPRDDMEATILTFQALQSIQGFLQVLALTDRSLPSSKSILMNLEESFYHLKSLMDHWLDISDCSGRVDAIIPPRYAQWLLSSGRYLRAGVHRNFEVFIHRTSHDVDCIMSRISQLCLQIKYASFPELSTAKFPVNERYELSDIPMRTVRHQ